MTIFLLLDLLLCAIVLLIAACSPVPPAAVTLGPPAGYHAAYPEHTSTPPYPPLETQP